MKMLWIALLGMMLFACTGKTDPVGRYNLIAGGIRYELSIAEGGRYVLAAYGNGGAVTEIRGPWRYEDDDSSGRLITLEGIVWRGNIPHGEPGYWIALLEGSRRHEICLDGESLVCFEKE